MSNDPAGGAANERFDRIGAQATESLRGDARRVHELAEQFRAQYRHDLEEWMQLRARLDRRGGAVRPLGTDALRGEYEHRGRELATLQARLKRLDVVARRLDLLWTYLESDEPMVDEPSLNSDDATTDINLRIVQAHEAERQRMAGDIHDGPAQVLANAIFQVEYLDRMLGDGDREAQSEVAFLRDMLRSGLDEVRTLITDLRPPVLDVGLAVAITSRARSAANASANTARSRKPHRYNFKLFDSMHERSGRYSMTTCDRSGWWVTGQMDDSSSLVNRTLVTPGGAAKTST